MPKYFFHVTDGKKTYADKNGADLNDTAAAQAFARMIANNIAPDLEYQHYCIDVRDEQNNPVLKLDISTRH